MLKTALVACRYSFFFSSRRRHTRFDCDWSSDVCSSDLKMTWKVLRKINSLLPEGDLPSPSWAPGRLLKQRERTPMAVGVPRRTQSLCPEIGRASCRERG